jgi:hypothetical protein
VAAVLAVGLGAAAYFTFARGSAGSGPVPSPSVDIHSKEAVMAAVRHYYQVEADARKTGNADLIDPVTIGQGSVASENFHVFIGQQNAKNRRASIDHNYFSDWEIQLGRDRTSARYKWWLHGHDTDASSGNPVEPDMTSTKGIYRATLELRGSQWLVAEVQLLQDNVP